MISLKKKLLMAGGVPDKFFAGSWEVDDDGWVKSDGTVLRRTGRARTGSWQATLQNSQSARREFTIDRGISEKTATLSVWHRSFDTINTIRQGFIIVTPKGGTSTTTQIYDVTSSSTTYQRSFGDVKLPKDGTVAFQIRSLNNGLGGGVLYDDWEISFT